MEMYLSDRDLSIEAKRYSQILNDIALEVQQLALMSTTLHKSKYINRFPQHYIAFTMQSAQNSHISKQTSMFLQKLMVFLADIQNMHKVLMELPNSSVHSNYSNIQTPMQHQIPQLKQHNSMNACTGGDKSPSSIFPSRNFIQPQRPLASTLSGGAALASALGFKFDQKPQSNNPLLTKP